MIIYKEDSVTKRGGTSVDTLSYYGSADEISDANLKDGLNHIRVTTGEEQGFCKILFVIGGTAYVAAPTNYSDGTLVLKLGETVAKQISIAETVSLTAVK